MQKVLSSIGRVWRSGCLGKVGIVFVVFLLIGIIQSALGLTPEPSSDDATASPIAAAAATAGPTETTSPAPTATIPAPTEQAAAEPLAPTATALASAGQPAIDLLDLRLPVSRDEIQTMLEGQGITFNAETPSETPDGVPGVIYEDRSRGMTIHLYGEKESLFRVLAAVDFTQHPDALSPFLDYISPVIEQVVPSIGDGRQWISDHMSEVSEEGQYIETIGDVEIGLGAVQGGLVVTIIPVAGQ